MQYEKLRKLGIVVAMIAAEAPDKVLDTAKAYEVPFPLMANPDKSVLEAYNVLNEKKKAAVPAMFLIGKDKKVKWAHGARDYKTRPEVDDLVAALEKVVAK